MVSLIILISVCAQLALLFNETQPVPEDNLARLESSFEVVMLVYRIVVVAFTEISVAVFKATPGSIFSWLLVALYQGSSISLVSQYYKFVPYYNPIVSTFFGSMVVSYLWITINAALMMLFRELDGQLLVLSLGLPMIPFFVSGLRKKRISGLINQGQAFNMK